MAEYDMRKPDGDPFHDLAAVCDYNESLIIDAVNQERAEKAAKSASEKRNRRGRR